MSNSHNEYYSNVIDELKHGKDSIFEPAEILSFDRDTFTVKAFGLRSQQTKENVILTFSAFNVTNGIINIPSNGTKGFVYVGPDNENYFLPIQYILPTNKNNNGLKVRKNSSPEQLDPYSSITELEPGETLLLNESGTQLLIKNSGELEVTTAMLHRISLDAMNGMLEKTIASKKESIGYSKRFDGLVNNELTGEAEHFYYEEGYRSAPNWKKEKPVSLGELKDISDNNGFENMLLADEDPVELYTYQRGHVYKDLSNKGEKIISRVDGTDLYSRFILNDLNNNNSQVYTEDISSMYNKEKFWHHEDKMKHEIDSVDLSSKKMKVGENSTEDITTPFGSKVNYVDKDGELIIEKNADEVTVKKGAMQFNIKENVIRLKVGEETIRVENGDITFQTKKGKTSINEIISFMQEG